MATRQDISERRDILLSIPSPHLLLSSLFLVTSNTFSEFPFWKFFCSTLSLYFVFRFHAQDRGSSNVLITRVAWVRSNGQLAGRSTTQALPFTSSKTSTFCIQLSWLPYVLTSTKIRYFNLPASTCDDRDATYTIQKIAIARSVCLGLLRANWSIVTGDRQKYPLHGNLSREGTLLNYFYILPTPT